MPSLSRSATAVLVLAGAAAYLGARTFIAPGTPVLLAGDQGFFWMYADRMLHGERPYRDFFQFTPPGTDVVYLAAFAVFGARTWVASAVVVALGVALGGVCFRVARDLMGDASAALAAAIFVVLVFGQTLTGTHHGWSALCVMCAVASFTAGDESASAPRFAVAGALLGLASFFTQTHGVAGLAAFAVFAVWRARHAGLPRRGAVVEGLASLFGGFAAALLAASAYFLATVGVGPMEACLVSYVWKHMGYAEFRWDLGLPEAPTWRSAGALAPYGLVYALVPTGYALACRRFGRERALGEPGDRNRERVALLWIVGVALLAEVAVNLSWLRLLSVCMPAVVLLLWAAEGSGRVGRAFRATAWIGVVGFAALLVRSTRRHHSVVAELPAGRAATDPSKRGELDWLARHITPGTSFFATEHPSIYFPLRLRDPLYLDAAVPGPQTSLELATRAVQELESFRVDTVMWSPRLEAAREDEGLAGIAVLRSYVHAHYHRVQIFSGGDEAWARD
jgi:hypothetical protein